MLDLEVLVLLADPALAEGDELLALGEGAHRHGPLFEGNRHRVAQVGSCSRTWAPVGAAFGRSLPAQSGGILEQRREFAKFVPYVASSSRNRTTKSLHRRRSLELAPVRRALAPPRCGNPGSRRPPHRRRRAASPGRARRRRRAPGSRPARARSSPRWPWRPTIPRMPAARSAAISSQNRPKSAGFAARQASLSPVWATVAAISFIRPARASLTRSSNTGPASGRHRSAPPTMTIPRTRSPSRTAACSTIMQPTEWPTRIARSTPRWSSTRSRSLPRARPSTGLGGLVLRPAPRWS